MKCGNCRFWEQKKAAAPNNGVRMGFCRCNPPIATGCFVPKANRIANTVTPQLVEMTLWPQVSANNWCGEFQDKVKAFHRTALEQELRLISEKLGCKDCFKECEHFDDCKAELKKRVALYDRNRETPEET